MTQPDTTPDLLASLSQAVSESDRSRIVQAEPSLRSPQTVQALCDQAARDAREDPTTAQKPAQAALWLAETIAHPPSVGLAHRTLANVNASLSRTNEAFAGYQAALAIFSELNDPLQEAVTRSSALPTVTETFGAEVAFEWAERAREVFKAKSDNLRLARLENNLAILFFLQEDYQQALQHWKMAHLTLAEIGETSDEATALRNLAVCCINLNQPEEAQAYYEKARHLCKRHNYLLLLHEIDYNIAYLHYLQGDHHKALQLYEAARARSRRLGDKYHEALCSLDSAQVYIELNLLEEANTVAQLAATQFGEQERPYETAKSLFSLALVSSRRGDPRAALVHLDAAAGSLAGRGNIFWPGQIELLRASVYFSEGRLFEARRSSRIALRLFTDSGLILRAALARLLLAQTHLAQGDSIEAEKLARRSAQTLKTFGDPDSLFQAHFTLGKILDAQGDAEGALACFHYAEENLIEVRQRRAVSPARISVVDQPLDLYSHILGLYLGHQPESDLTPELFGLVETAKARSFADLMAVADESYQHHTAMRSQLVDHVSRLRQELAWLYRRIDRSELPESSSRLSQAESLRLQSRTKERELAERLALLRVRSTNTAHDPESIGIADLSSVQAALGETALLEFFVAQDTVLAIVLTQSTRKILPIAIASTIQDLQRRLRYHLDHQSHLGTRARSTDPLESLLDDLFRELLLPLASLLDSRSLLIVPHGFLFAVPFHALRFNGQYLIEHCSISYIPTASTLPKITGISAPKAHRVALVSPADSQKQIQPWLAALCEETDTGLRQENTVSAVPDLESLSAMHLIGSARLRSDNPLLSSISVGDQEITILDLFRSRVLAPFVSLEGNGFVPKTSAGYELSSLWGALLSSGSCCVSMSGAPGSPDFQAEYLQLLYRELLAGATTATAHRKAILTLMGRGARLTDWSSMLLIGNPFLRLA